MAFRRALPLTLFLASACAAPQIPEFDAAAVARTDRRATEVELCVLYQERDLRPRWQGVAELSSEKWDYAIASVAVKHPAGVLMLDPAFGTAIAQDLSRAGPIFTAIMGPAGTKRPLLAVMAEAGLRVEDVRYALVTHVHWDHTGALGDLRDAKVLINRVDLEWLRPFRQYLDHGAMPHHLSRARQRLSAFDLSGPPVDGFAASFDVFGDGAVVVVPLPGHTPGSVGVLVRGKGGTHWLFSGDTTWTFRGVELPAHKTLRAFDSDLLELSRSIGRLHALQQHRPDVQVIPAHDGAALSRLPQCKAATARSN